MQSINPLLAQFSKKKLWKSRKWSFQIASSLQPETLHLLPKMKKQSRKIPKFKKLEPTNQHVYCFSLKKKGQNDYRYQNHCQVIFFWAINQLIVSAARATQQNLRYLNKWSSLWHQSDLCISDTWFWISKYFHKYFSLFKRVKVVPFWTLFLVLQYFVTDHFNNCLITAFTQESTNVEKKKQQTGKCVVTRKAARKLEPKGDDLPFIKLKQPYSNVNYYGWNWAQLFINVIQI